MDTYIRWTIVPQACAKPARETRGECKLLNHTFLLVRFTPLQTLQSKPGPALAICCPTSYSLRTALPLTAALILSKSAILSSTTACACGWGNAPSSCCRHSCLAPAAFVEDGLACQTRQKDVHNVALENIQQCYMTQVLVLTTVLTVGLYTY